MSNNYEFEEAQKPEEQATHEIEMETRVLAPIELGFSGAISGASGGDQGGRSGGGGGGVFRSIKDTLISAGGTPEQASAIASLGKRPAEAIAAIGEDIARGILDGNGLQKMHDALVAKMGDAPKDSMGSKAIDQLSELIKEEMRKADKAFSDQKGEFEQVIQPTKEFPGLLERLRKSMETPDRKQTESGFFGNLRDKIQGSQQPQLLGPFNNQLPEDFVKQPLRRSGSDPSALYQA